MVGQCELKLIDFGMAEIVTGPLRSPKESTAHYLAPEVMRVNRRMQGVPGYGLDADAWSFGICLYYWYTGYFPFADDEHLPFDIYNAVLYCGDGPSYEDIPHSDLQPQDRPTFADIQEAPFFHGLCSP